MDGWVIFDNLQGANLVGTYAGQWVKQNLGGKAQVALLTHQIQLTGRQRVEGCVKALQAVAPGAKVVAQHEGVLSPDTFPAFQTMLRLIPGSTSRSDIADVTDHGGADVMWSQTPPVEPFVVPQGLADFGGKLGETPGQTGGPIRATGALDAVAIGKACITAAANAIEGKSPTKINFPYVLCTFQTKAVNQKLLAELNS